MGRATVASVRLSGEEHERLQLAAREAHLPVSTLIRMLAPNYKFAKVRVASQGRWFDPLNAANSVERPVEGGDSPNASALGRGDEIGLGEVDSVHLVHLYRS